MDRSFGTGCRSLSLTPSHASMVTSSILGFFFFFKDLDLKGCFIILFYFILSRVVIVSFLSCQKGVSPNVNLDILFSLFGGFQFLFLCFFVTFALFVSYQHLFTQVKTVYDFSVSCLSNHRCIRELCIYQKLRHQLKNKAQHKIFSMLRYI